MTARSVRPADLRALARGGGLLTRAVSQPSGALLGTVALRAGGSARVVTFTSLAVGLGTSALVVLLDAPLAQGLVALVGWQLAYALDCADGQVARFTGTASPFGARLDVLCDLAGTVALVVAVVVAVDPPPALGAAFAALQGVNLLLSVLTDIGGDRDAHRLLPSSGAGDVLRLVRDHPVQVTALALGLAVPALGVPVLVALAGLHAALVLAMVAVTTRRAGD